MDSISYTSASAVTHPSAAVPGSRTANVSPHDPAVPSAGAHTADIAPEGRVADGIRRAADIFLSSIALLVLTPVFVLVGLAIKVTSPGPVLYRQTRVGLNRRWEGRRAPSETENRADRRKGSRRNVKAHGKPFEIVKFRTMVFIAEG